MAAHCYWCVAVCVTSVGQKHECIKARTKSIAKMKGVIDKSKRINRYKQAQDSLNEGGYIPPVLIKACPL